MINQGSPGEGEEHMKNVIRVFFILTVALITVAILRSFM